ncbi:hypothetical protein JCM3774_005622 [Rhodotorula dairenensis]
MAAPEAGGRYSFSLTTFSPSGKLVQIEHALAAVGQGTTSLGIKATNGIVVATSKKAPSPLVDDSMLEKVALICPNIGMVYSGMGPDFRVLVAKARKSAQAYWKIYGEYPSTRVMVGEIATVMQDATQSGGVRPFGVSLLVAGFDNARGHTLYQVDPSGSFWAWKASAIGKNQVNAKTFLEKRYNDDLSLEDAIHTALLTLKEGFEGVMDEKTIELGVITTQADEGVATTGHGTGLAGTPGFRKLTEAEVADFCSPVPDIAEVRADEPFVEMSAISVNRHVGSSEQERRPLLPKPGAGHDAEEAPMKERTPLPLKQVLVLCLMRFAEPVAFSLIFPFISQFIEDLKVTDDPSRIGYYAGIIESLFAFTTFSTVLAWGRLSDRIGRKPVLIIGLTGVTVSIVSFGMSKAFWMLVVSRCFGGALNGNVAVIKSMLGEITDESNQARAFSFLPLAWSLGSVIGPLLGGYLSHPAEQFPSVFGHSAFLKANPYALPCLIGALFPFFGALLGIFFLEETLKPTRPLGVHPSDPEEIADEVRGTHRRDASKHTRFVAATSTTLPAPREQLRRLEEDSEGPDSGYSTPRSASVSGRRGDSPSKLAPRVGRAPPTFRSMFTRRVNAALGVYAMLALITVALDALIVLFCYSPVKIGGLGFKEADIGIALSVSGLSSVTFQILLFPPLQQRVGTVRLYRRLMSLWPLVYALFPIMSWCAREKGRRAVWVVLTCFLVLKAIANMAYACNMIAITDAAPSKRLLGSLNGVAQMCSSLMRSIGPFGASSLFAFSVSRQLLGGQLVFLIMIVLAIVGAATTLALHEGGRAMAVEDPAEE